MASENRMSANKPRQRKPALLGPKRALFQWLTTLLIIGLPFIRVSGESLLRLDFPTLTLHAFGHRFPVTDLYLFLLLGIALTFLFLLVTLAFGRAWCGWACPQTSLVDFVEWLARRIGIKVIAGEFKTNSWQKLALQCTYLLLAILVGANLVWYFISPYHFFPALFRGDLHWVATMTMLIVAGFVYLDLAFLRRLLCKEFCPYGRFQTVLVDPGTLTLHYHPDEASRCIQCGACVRSCPTGIDIRRGYQIECINCGRCLDACREVMAKRHQPGIIRYTFGLDGKGLAALFNVRMALVTFTLVAVLGGLLVVTTQRDAVSLTIGRNPELLPRRINAEKVVNFYSAYLTNRTEEEIQLRLAIASPENDLELSGPTSLQRLGARERRRLDFSVIADIDSLAEPRAVGIQLLSQDNQRIAEMELYLTKPRTSDE